MMTLANQVSVARRFQRSVRIDADFRDPKALEGFVCPESSANLLITMARHIEETGQAAFTWTGPYGSGKSTLAVALCSLLSSSPRVRNEAAHAIGKSHARSVWRAFQPKEKGWQVLPVVGQRGRLCDIIGHALTSAGFIPKGEVRRWTDDRVVEAVGEIAARRQNVFGGLLLLLDEMGKCLEGAAQENYDVFLLQRLAEFAARSKGRFVFIGILHQAFDEYANRVARDLRDEWSKVQGRFVDLIVNMGGDEQLELLSRAIECDRRPAQHRPLAKLIAEKVRQSRLSASEVLEDILFRCWPLHPVVACLLGPLSRRRFGQNQRSLFGFLNSAEPIGFQDFLRNATDRDSYRPSQLWDYLSINLEPSILASPDGHRWSMAVEATERCIVIGANDLHLEILKTIALLDLFRERSGMSATSELLAQCCAPGTTRSQVDAALKQLQAWSFIVFRKHLDAFAVHAGSDFDIEQALTIALDSIRQIDFRHLRALAGLQPILAKRHYHETGAVRWFEVDIASTDDLMNFGDGRSALGNGVMGRFVLAIPPASESKPKIAKLCQAMADASDGDIIVGLSAASWQVVQLAREFLALTKISEDSPELSGDAVARREVIARIADVRARLESDLQKMFKTAEWHRKGMPSTAMTYAQLNTMTSDVADEKYSLSPRIGNELLNRLKPSSNAMAAQKALLKQMVLHEGDPRLGIEGFPAEGGLCESILVASGLYRKIGEGWRFAAPSRRSDPSNLLPAWSAAEDLLKAQSSRSVNLSELYELWSSAPFGLKDGLAPILAVTFVLANRDKLAIYREGIFQAHFTDLDVDYLAIDPTSVQLRWMDLSTTSRRMLEGLAEVVRSLDTENQLVHLKPIDVARGLVAIHEKLKPWVKRTTHISANALRIRSLFKFASDPNKFVFDDIPHLIGESSTASVEEVVAHIREGLAELVSSYDNMLRRLQEMMLTELQVPNTSPRALSELRARAENVRELGGDFRLNAFVGRLCQFKGDPSDMEGVASLAANKPPRDWVDADLDQASVEIADLAQKFNRSEAFARVKGRPDKRQAMAVVVGVNGRPTPLHKEFDITDADRIDVNDLIDRVTMTLEQCDQDRRNVILAALAEISARYMQLDSKIKKANGVRGATTHA